MTRKRHARRWLSVAMLAVVASALMATTALAYTTPVNKTILGSGSDTTYYLMANIDALYNQSPGCTIIIPAPTTVNPQPLDFTCQPDGPGTITTENYHHNNVVTEYPLGSGNGRRQLCDQTDTTHINPVFVDYARSSSFPSGCTGVHAVAVAREAITWECWPGVAGSGCAGMAVKNLSQQQIRDIYTCVDTNWSQVGGNNVPIVLYADQDNSGTRSTWDAFVGASPGPCAIKIEENFNAPIIAAGNQAGAFFPMATSSWNFHEKGDGSQLNGIDGQAPTTAKIRNGQFPFGRYVYNVYCDATCPATHGATSQAALDYMGVNVATFHPRDGFICQATHGVDPVTGQNYTNLIRSVITGTGFVTLALGPTGGGATGNSYCKLDAV